MTKKFLWTVIALAVSTMGTVAHALEPARGEVLLTISGAISETNSGNTAVFDRTLLEAMEPVTVKTSTIWTDGVQTFVGVSLNTIMDAVGADGETVRASAINDYAVEIPISDAIEGGPIVAYLRNGNAMSIRDKGPLWIVYPFDSSPDYQSELIYSRSIWQLDRIEVRP